MAEIRRPKNLGRRGKETGSKFHLPAIMGWPWIWWLPKALRNGIEIYFWGWSPRKRWVRI